MICCLIEFVTIFQNFDLKLFKFNRLGPFFLFLPINLRYALKSQSLIRIQICSVIAEISGHNEGAHRRSCLFVRKLTSIK